ncbi:MAG: SsrA-binding protein SmpB [Defluviitaleaceae bacterium]|nr:SsrA-binding protein SmpB [Defluviitaleaceae bacterium]MCL2835978.1 SsrA-binding protein SmpB [Defluviitaleaceae bacterium]
MQTNQNQEKKTVIRNIAQNKKAYHDYYIEDTYQAGIELSGTEVKSMRAGRCNFKDSYIEIAGREAFVVNMHISPYEHGNIFNRDPLRKRRLLLNRWEINKLNGAITRQGYTVVPLRAYFQGSYVKIDIALAKGKKLYDKRDAIAERDRKRDEEHEFRERTNRRDD